MWEMWPGSSLGIRNAPPLSFPLRAGLACGVPFSQRAQRTREGRRRWCRRAGKRRPGPRGFPTFPTVGEPPRALLVGCQPEGQGNGGGGGGGWGAHASSPLGTHYTYFRTHHRKTGCVWSFKRGSFKGAVLCPSFCSGAAGLPVQPTSYSTSCTVLASSSTRRLRRVGASARRRCSAASVVPSASPCVPR